MHVFAASGSAAAVRTAVAAEDALPFRRGLLPDQPCALGALLTPRAESPRTVQVRGQVLPDQPGAPGHVQPSCTWQARRARWWVLTSVLYRVDHPSTYVLCTICREPCSALSGIRLVQCTATTRSGIRDRPVCVECGFGVIRGCVFGRQ
jgi:hypothetical protein